jgi:hypothetical protein
MKFNLLIRQNGFHLENEIPDSNNPHHIQISLEILVKNINSSHNWKSRGGDQIHNFWLKKFTCIHKCLLDHFNGFIREPNTFPEFLAHGITYLKPKDSDTKNPSKYRPITYLPTIYKIMTSCIKVIIYDHFQKLNILPLNTATFSKCVNCDQIRFNHEYLLFKSENHFHRLIPTYIKRACSDNQSACFHPIKNVYRG